jgi:S-DNA-T family DNA segregation ATPase FtsK/SpoIIIE
MVPTTLGLGFAGGSLALGAIFLISILVLFDTPLHLGIFRALFSLFKRSPKPLPALDDEAKITMSKQAMLDDTPAIIVSGGEPIITNKEKLAEAAVPAPEALPREPKEPVIKGIDTEIKKEGKTEPTQFAFNKMLHEAFTPPPISILSGDKGKVGYGDIKGNSNLIKRTLQNFGVDVEMDEITVGPSITRYAMKPAESVRLSKIVQLQRELEYALALAPIRIEAPIPGKSLVGIEVPNTTKSTVGLASLLSDNEWSSNPNPLFVPLGKGISGNGIFMNIAKMPHILVAGATGSGKSVAMHTIITSLLYRNSPEQLRFIMVDPKRVELTLYNGIPHLLTPVITEAKKAILTLKWAAKEMDRRYDVLQENKVQDIASFHKHILQPELEKYDKKKNAGNATLEDEKALPELMPYIVVIIDELADIMTAYPRELESAIVRLAQMSRAVGIHLMIATQRPSVNVITGLIKANIPARIALKVLSQIDSRTILDMSGAENLLGQGDMLFLSPDLAKPVRIQSAFISGGEVKNVVKFFKDNYDGVLGDELNIGTSENRNAYFGISEEALTENSGADDDMYDEAKAEVIASGKASTSYLQRKLGIGYARAAKLIDILEENGVVGPGNGAKPREVLMRGDNKSSGFGSEAEGG